MDVTDEHTASDAILMARLGAGELSALGVLYARHGAMVKSAVRCYAPNIGESEIDDLSQDVFLQLKRTAAYYTERGRFRAWLFGIASQAAKNWLKTGATRADLLKVFGAQPPAMGLKHTGSPETCAEARELIWKLFDALPEGQREVFYLHAVEEFSAREIGEILGLSENAVWTRLHRGRNAIVSRLEEIERAKGNGSRASLKVIS